MKHLDRITALFLIAMLTLPMALTTIPMVWAAPETIETDKALYKIKWEWDAEAEEWLPYVNMTVKMDGLVKDNLYLLNVMRYASVEFGYEDKVVRNYTTAGPAVSGPVWAQISMGWPVRELAGTYYLILYDETLGHKQVAGPIWFGVWGLTSLTYNFCDEITAIGGGFNKTAAATVALDDNKTGNIFPTTYAVDDYGIFEAVGDHLIYDTNGTEGEWINITLTSYTLRTPNSGTGVEIWTLFNVTRLLDVTVYTDLFDYVRTDTMTIYAQVLKQSGEPVTDADIAYCVVRNQTEFIIVSWEDNESNDTAQLDYVVKNWSMTETWGLYSAKYKIRINDEVGYWNISLRVEDPCGNFWDRSPNATWCHVIPATLVKLDWIQPMPIIEKTDTAVFVFNVTYPDDTAATLNASRCTVYILYLGPEDEFNTTAVSLVPWTDAGAGVYNATFLIPPTYPNGTYQFLIQADELFDNVNQTRYNKSTPANTGPAEDNYSDIFAVGPYKMLVYVWTSSTATKTEKYAFAKGDTVAIWAWAKYKDGTYLVPRWDPRWTYWPHTTVSTATLTVNVYWPEPPAGNLSKTITLTFVPPTRWDAPLWTGTYPTNATYPAGIYLVNCTADDKKGNTGWDTTTFLLAGLILVPTEGTVPPDWLVSYDNETCLVSAEIYSVERFTGPQPATLARLELGTEVTISAPPDTLTANTTFIITIEAADIAAIPPTLAWYTDVLEVPNVATRGIWVANVTTNPDGSLTETTFVFPSMPEGAYTLLAIKNDTRGDWTKDKALASNDFIVIPGLLVAPKTIGMDGASHYTTGDTLCEVVATGYPVESIWAPTVVESIGGILRWNNTLTVLLINGTDALLPHALQSWAAKQGFWYMGWPMVPIEWRFDGTATLLQALSAETKVIPGFVIPVLQPGVYQIDLLVIKVSSNATFYALYTGNQTITTVSIATDYVGVYGVTKELIDLIKDLDAKVVEVNGTVARIETLLGTVELKLDAINATVTGIEGDIATLTTALGDVEVKVDAISATLVDIEGDVATIETTVGDLEVKLDAINATVTSIEDNVATIETTVGTIEEDVATIKTKVDTISGTVATLSTTVGTIATDVESIKGTVGGLSMATYAAAGLSLVAAIAAAVAVWQITRKVYLK